MAGENVYQNVSESFASKITSRDDELFTQRMVFSWLAGLQGIALTGQATGQQLNPVAYLADLLGGLKAVQAQPKAVTTSVDRDLSSKTVNDDSQSTLIEQMTSQVMQRATEQISKSVEELVAADTLAQIIGQVVKQAIEEVLPDIAQ